MSKDWKEDVEKASESEAIYQPKYGGTDHSGYDTRMLYEVNFERMEAFENGAEWAKAYFADLLAAKDTEIQRLQKLVPKVYLNNGKPEKTE